jgi:hypothetical protein
MKLYGTRSPKLTTKAHFGIIEFTEIEPQSDCLACTLEVTEPGKEEKFITQSEWFTARRLKRDAASDTVEFVVPPNARNVRAVYEIPVPQKIVTKQAEVKVASIYTVLGEIVARTYKVELPANAKNIKCTYEVTE